MCLCHGNMGLLLLLNKYLAIHSSEELKKIRRLLTCSSLEVLEKAQMMPQEKYAKGLMNGMTGIGYACLQLAGITSLPDVMLCNI